MVAASRNVSASEPALVLPITLRHAHGSIDASVDVLDPAGEVWRPRSTEGALMRARLPGTLRIVE